MSAAVNEAIKYLESIFDALGDAIVVFDVSDYQIEFANKALYEISGYDAQEVHNRSVGVIFGGDKNFKDFCGKLKENINGFTVQYELSRQDDKKIFVEIKCLPVYENPKVKRAVLVIRDLTKQINVEAESEKRRLQALQTYKMEAIGRFTAGIAHDFNNILTSILGFSKLAMNRGKEGDPLYGDLEEIYKASERAGFLTKQLLFFSRKQPMKSRVFQINNTITNIAAISAWMVGEDINIVQKLSADAWSLFGDEIKIEQVIINMLQNARDAMPKGGNIIITTENVDISKSYVESFGEAKYGKYVCITIQDSGAGMDKTTLEHVFEPFYTTKEIKQGAGLGLFISYGIVKQHGGWIDYDSTPGCGTIFEVYLPIAEPGEKSSEDKMIILQDYHGKDERILLVEDEETVRKFASETLSMFGYRVFEAESGKEALELFKKEKGDFALLLTDVKLGDMMGDELAGALLKENPGLNVILTSGYTDKKFEAAAFARKNHDFLRKPYSVEDLLQSVKEIIIKHG